MAAARTPTSTYPSTQQGLVGDEGVFAGWSWRAPEKMGDRDPDTVTGFPAVLAMREAKLLDWLRITARLQHTLADYIACCDFMADPR